MWDTGFQWVNLTSPLFCPPPLPPPSSFPSSSPSLFLLLHTTYYKSMTLNVWFTHETSMSKIVKIFHRQTDRRTDRQTDRPTRGDLEAPSPELKKHTFSHSYTALMILSVVEIEKKCTLVYLLKILKTSKSYLSTAVQIWKSRYRGIAISYHGN